jgi:hypothetical protein
MRRPGVAHGLGHAGEVAIAREADEAVADVLALEEDEERENDREQRCGEGFDDAAELIEASGGAADFANLNGVFGGGAEGFGVGLTGGRDDAGGVGDAEFFTDVLDFALGAAVRGVARAVEGLHFLRDVVAVGWQVVGDGNELGEESPCGDHEQDGEGENDAEGGDGAREAHTFEKRNDGGEEEGEEDGESEGEQENFGEIEDGNGENGDGDEPELAKPVHPSGLGHFEGNGKLDVSARFRSRHVILCEQSNKWTTASLSENPDELGFQLDEARNRLDRCEDVIKDTEILKDCGVGTTSTKFVCSERFPSRS